MLGENMYSQKVWFQDKTLLNSVSVSIHINLGDIFNAKSKDLQKAKCPRPCPSCDDVTYF